MQILLLILIGCISFVSVNAIGGLATNFGYTYTNYASRFEYNPFFNFVYKAFMPVICPAIPYLILAAIGINLDYSQAWKAVVLQWIIRYLYVIFWQRTQLINLPASFAQSLVSISTAFLINYIAAHSPSSIFPTRDNMVSEIWLLIILFVYKVFDGTSVWQNNSYIRKSEYINYKYTVFKKKYGAIVSALHLCENVEILGYSILIFENYNRPFAARIIEIALSPFKKTGTYGVMQVRSTKPMANAKSVEAGFNHVKELYEKIRDITIRNNEKAEEQYHFMESVLSRVAWHFNNDDKYSDEIMIMYNQIKRKFYTKQPVLSPEFRFDAFKRANS